MSYGDRELKLNDTGEDVTELQIKLGGWFGTYPGEKPRWSGTLDTATENAVKLFQVGHNLPDTGVVDHWTFTRLDQEADNHPFSFYEFHCPTKGRSGCKGFGTGRNSFTITEDGKQRTILIDGGEKPGVSKVLIWLLRGLLHRGDCSYFLTRTGGGGYRCAYDNESKNRESFNHMGEAIDIIPYRPDWSDAKVYTTYNFPAGNFTSYTTTAVQNFRDICAAAGIPNDVREDDTVYMERDTPAAYRGYHSMGWVHLDVRTALATIGHESSWYVQDQNNLNSPYYAGQLLSFATATPPNPPAAPTPYPKQEQIEAEVLADSDAIEAWLAYYNDYTAGLERNSSELAGITDPTPLEEFLGDIDAMIAEAMNIRINGVTNLHYSLADIMEATRRSEIMSLHTRDDYRAFGELTNDKIVGLLRRSDARFRRRYENFITPAEDCGDG